MIVGANERLEKLLVRFHDAESNIDAGDVLDCVMESVTVEDCWFVPVEILPDGMNETDVEEGGLLDELSMFRKMVITNKNDESFYCAFTSEKEMNARRKEGTQISVKYKARAMLRDLLETDDEIKGVVINPWTESFVIRKDNAEMILQLADKVPESVAASFKSYRLEP